MTEESSLSTLRPVYLEVFKWLEPKELAFCSMVCRDLYQVTSNPFLWFHLYSTKYRTHFAAPPPSFEQLLAGTATTDLRLDDFSWRDLAIRREKLSASGALLETQSHAELEITESNTGRIDIIHTGNLRYRTATAMVVEWHVRSLILPLCRPVAYLELFVKGGSSCGLLPQNWKSARNFLMGSPFTRHVGWTRGSLGWHGDTGEVFCNNEKHPFGPSFGYDPDLIQENNVTNAPTQPDVVGVGMEPDRRTVFFTKNGTLVGSVLISEETFAQDTFCYFSVCLNNIGDFASVNFGAARFVFDIEEYSQLPPPCPSLQL